MLIPDNEGLFIKLRGKAHVIEPMIRNSSVYKRDNGDWGESDMVLLVSKPCDDRSHTRKIERKSGEDLRVSESSYIQNQYVKDSGLQRVDTYFANEKEKNDELRSTEFPCYCKGA